jgi:hypothetical protein
MGAGGRSTSRVRKYLESAERRRQARRGRPGGADRENAGSSSAERPRRTASRGRAGDERDDERGDERDCRHDDREDEESARYSEDKFRRHGRDFDYQTLLGVTRKPVGPILCSQRI